MEWITPVEIAPSTSGSWQVVDVSGSVPSGGTGVILHIHNHSGSAQAVGWKKNDSTDDRKNSMYAGGTPTHLWCAIGVDGDRKLELYVGTTTDLDVWLVGYFSADAVFFDEGIDKSLGSSGSWLDIDISSDTGGDTAIGAIFEVHPAPANRSWGFRMDESSDDRTYDVDSHGAAIIGVDGSEICEGKISNTSVDFFLVGYIKSGATFLLNATDLSLGSTGSWLDLSALPSGATGGFIEVKSGNYGQGFGLREDGSSEDIKGGCAGEQHAWGMVKADGSRIIEGYISSTSVDFFLVGYPTAGGTVYDERGKTQTVKVAVTADDVHGMVETGLAAAINIALSKTEAQAMVETGLGQVVDIAPSGTDAVIIDEAGAGQVVDVLASGTDVPVYIETGHEQVVNVAPSRSDTQTMVESLAQTLVVAQSRSDTQAMVEALAQIVDIVASGTDVPVYIETGHEQVLNVAPSGSDVQAMAEPGEQVVNVAATRTDVQASVESVLQTVLVTLTGTDAATWIEQQTQAALVAATGTDVQVIAESLAQQINVALSGNDVYFGGAVKLLRRLVAVTDGLITAR